MLYTYLFLMEQVNALEVIREAMELEKEGVKFYRKAAKCAKSKGTEKVFNQLSDDEFKHLEKLELVYDNLAENNEWLVMKDLMESDRGETPDIFNEDFDEEEIDELEAVELGIKAEEDSIRFYRDAYEKCVLAFSP